MYPYQKYNNSINMVNPDFNRGGDRQFFFPFLVGAVAGGAAVGLTRPRPVYVNRPYYPYAYPYYPYGYGYHNSYGYYNPYYRKNN